MEGCRADAGLSGRSPVRARTPRPAREGLKLPGLRPFLHLYWRFSRGLTLGVRAVVIDARERVFLVRHTYARGWHFPGGGVEPGEAVLDAARRELLEEARIEIAGEPHLHGVFFNA